jgi:hypothetical protein
MDTKKGCALGCSALLLLAVGAFILATKLTQPVVDAGEQFLTLCGQGKLGEAYQSTSVGFKESVDEAAFEEIINSTPLGSYASSSWSQRKIENNWGLLEGSITTRGGQKAPLRIMLIHENNVWRVQNVNLLNGK